MNESSKPISIQHRRTATASSSQTSSNSSSPRLTSFASALTDATPLTTPTGNPASLGASLLPPNRFERQASGLRTTPLTPQGQPLPGPPAPLNLSRLATSVVPSRSGSVLSRGLILKSDYRYVAPPSASQTEASAFADPEHEQRTHAQADTFSLGGATNFRDGGLGIWGTAQPSETGILSVLTLLRSKNDAETGAEGCATAWCCLREEPIIYIGAQPFVLREASHPTRTYSISNRAENLEEIEARLKQDVLKESLRYGGLVLIHSEDASATPSKQGSSHITPTWVSADNVRTVRELFSQIREAGYNVTFHRTPVSRDQSPGDGYLDHYTSLISTVPTTSSLVFNCGVGVVRTTFAMSAALIVRRKQLLEEGAVDPYGLATSDIGDGGIDVLGSPTLRSQDKATAERMIKGRLEQAERDRSLLRLMHVLSKSLPAGSQGTILSLLSLHSGLMENLRSALLGKYDIVLSLLSTLDDGSATKKVVDSIIDHCDALVNLRESVLAHRVRYASLALLDEQSAAEHRSQALAALQRYFFLVTFGAFVEETPLPTKSSTSPPVTFSTWLKSRSEIQNMISRMNKTGHFFIFSPVHDLSAIARGGDGADGKIGMTSKFLHGKFRDIAAAGEVVGDEWAHQIIRNRSGVILRSGMILKNDQWLVLGENQEQVVRGAINFRRIPGGNTYGLSQPTHDGIRRVLETVKLDLKPNAIVHWLNLREEPLVYINGSPYVLRQEAVSLRNVKSYSGITASRLEVLEERLKSDVLAELRAFDGRILLATEAEDGSVNHVWETIEDESQVQTLRELMDSVKRELRMDEHFQFKRVPITAEKFPEFNDLRDILETVTTASPDDALIVNDQLGRGRTTRTLVVIKMVTNWLRHGAKRAPRSKRYSYTVINNLLRAVPRTGQEVKDAVDEAITACGHPFDLLETIEDARQAAEDTESEFDKKKWVARGLKELRAYFFLILLMCYLNETKPDTWREFGQTASYEEFVRQRPVFKTIERELDTADIDALVPLERPLADGTASNDEVADFVAQRSGIVLSSFTLLKSDFFSGLQKMSLPDRVDGAPNFRRVPLSFTSGAHDGAKSAAEATAENGPLVYGTGMPTADGLRRALERMGAKEMPVTWTSMREEPVLYIRSRPHVLRLFNQPLENVVTTGVTTATVEAMEAELKRDLLREREKTGGKVLLHDEVEENGTFEVTATWEEIQPEDVLTPREVFAKMQAEGLKVDYDRLPVTDEQSPIPGVFSRIEQRVSAALSKSSKAGLTMNCQM
ncbi:uncharacterized protein JCM15063_001257, partial [Sporobolomyces koalae]|uniref:uncharacterized protein n=1 Tax=Sporobolomyces koalae TaxID=500713 RepID=UPI00317891D5